MKKRIFMLLVLVTTLFLSAAFAEDIELISREALLEKYALADTTHVDEFIREYEITSDLLENVNIEECYSLFVKVRESEKNDYMYLLDKAQVIHTGGLQPEHITKVLWFWNPNSAVTVFLYDLENRTLYYGEENILHNLSASKSKPLTDAQCNAVLETIEKYQVENWEESYPSTVNDSTGWLFWELAIEYDDGSMLQFYGSGSNADNLPETFTEVRKGLAMEMD